LFSFFYIHNNSFFNNVVNLLRKNFFEPVLVNNFQEFIMKIRAITFRALLINKISTIRLIIFRLRLVIKLLFILIPLAIFREQYAVAIRADLAFFYSKAFASLNKVNTQFFFILLFFSVLMFLLLSFLNYQVNKTLNFFNKNVALLQNFFNLFAYPLQINLIQNKARPFARLVNNIVSFIKNNQVFSFFFRHFSIHRVRQVVKHLVSSLLTQQIVVRTNQDVLKSFHQMSVVVRTNIFFVSHLLSIFNVLDRKALSFNKRVVHLLSSLFQSALDLCRVAYHL
jgi:hypothetical protein